MTKLLGLDSNIIEKIDDTTWAQVCRQCGGKGYYQHINMNPDTMKIDKCEIVSCTCEDGINYGKRE